MGYAELAYAMKRLRLEFSEPGRVRVIEEPAPQPTAVQALVEVDYSAISPGTEMLFYRGQVPDSLPIDATIDALSGSVRYPLPYGYAAVARVTGIGAEVDPAWLGRRVPLGSFAANRPTEGNRRRARRMFYASAGMNRRT